MEIWEYQVVQLGAGNEGLFTPFINEFLKIKQEASGWPSNCVTEKDKENYIKEYHEKEGILLEPANITKNAGRRTQAKLKLNSFWGKFGQKENQTKTSIIREPGNLYRMIADPAIDVNHIQEINDNTVIINWSYIEEAADVSSIVNVCIAAYTTAQARLKLYSYLEKLEERVLYYDTDSVIYVSNKNSNEYEPPLGSFLGE